MGTTEGGDAPMTWDQVVTMALALPGTERSTCYGRNAITVRGKMILVIGRSDDHFVLTASHDDVELLMVTEPACFFQTPHYVGWPAVLVRLSAADSERIAILVERAWAKRATKTQRNARS